MGFLNRIKSTNNRWGYVTYLSDGSLNRLYGYIGPKNLINNKDQELMITGYNNLEIIFSMDDVESATVLQTTTEWVKYQINLKNGLSAVVVIMVMDHTTQGRGRNTSISGGNTSISGSGSAFANNWLAFESWLGEALSRGNNITTCVQQSNTVWTSSTSSASTGNKQKERPSVELPKDENISQEPEIEIDEASLESGDAVLDPTEDIKDEQLDEPEAVEKIESTPTTHASDYSEIAKEKITVFDTLQEIRSASVEASQSKPKAPREKTEREHLLYALRYETNEGMIGYLKAVRSDMIQGILKDIQDQPYKAREIVEQAAKRE